MKECKTCGSEFRCEFEEGSKQCWCADLPRVLEVNPSSSCLCPNCLSLEIKEKFSEKPEKALPYMCSVSRKNGLGKDFEKGLDYYINEAGNWVFTEYYHLKKGYCCQNGCKHCPYGYKNQPK